MNQYSIHINDTFCQKNLISPQISWDLGNFIDQNAQKLSKNILFEVSFHTICIDTTDTIKSPRL